MRMKMKKISTLLVLAFACVIAGLAFLLFPIGKKVTAHAANTSAVTVSGASTYNLFNSGCSGSGQNASGATSSCTNPAPNSGDNNGYDIYARCNAVDSIPGTAYSGCVKATQIGRSFYIQKEISERVNVSVNAYDVDESDGEVDYIYLIDETDGSSYTVGTLSGMGEQWNNTSFTIAPEQFETGHTYHYQVEVTSSRTGPSWWVYIRTVAMTVNGIEENDTNPITAASITGSISNGGRVSATLNVTSVANQSFTVEFKATHVATNNQVGSLNSSITTTPSGVQQSYSFSLTSGSPVGTYRIDAYLKDANGNVLKMISCNAGYSYYAVSYNANGGSNNCPIDDIAYGAGNTVTVKFDYIPSRNNYKFLGWSTNPSATIPTYTQNGVKTFTIGNSDVTLYAVWGSAACVHNYEEKSVIAASCTSNGVRTMQCTLCEDSYKEIIYATGHDYEVTEEKATTCTKDGYKVYTCSVCDATKKVTVETKGHSWGPTAEYHNPTCTEDGYWLTKCMVEDCGVSSRVEDYDSALGHDYTNCVETTPATCTEEGAISGACARCNEELDEVIPAKGHTLSYTDNKDEATHLAVCAEGDYSQTENHKAGLKVCVCGYVNPHYLSVLLIQDSTPWNVEANKATLDSLISGGHIDGWEQCTTTEFASIDATQYGAIVFANDQTNQTYANYSKIKAQLDAYVQGGGVLVFGACWHGWRGGTLSDTLLGGVGTAYDIDWNNYIANTAHPIVTGELTGNDSLVDNDLRSTYASHIYFTNLPQGANVIFQNEAGEPTLVEYAYGNGAVIASGLTWEYSTQYCSYAYFADKAMDDMILYALSISKNLPTEKKHTVTYKDYDGSVLFVERVLSGENAKAEVTPERAGYTFTGWDISLNNITGNVVATAQYTANSYQVTVLVAAAQGTVTGGDVYEIGESVILTATAKTGYVFIGWYIDGQLVCEALDFVYTVLAGDVTVEARFTKYIPEGSPVLKVEGGKVGVGDEFNAEVKLENNVGLNNITAYIHYDATKLELVDIQDLGLLGAYVGDVDFSVNPFKLSWTNATNINFEGVVIILIFRVRVTGADNTEISVENFTATDENSNSVSGFGGSSYTDIMPKHEVSFVGNGGSGVSGGVQVLEGGKLDNTVEPEKEGYTFGGWYKDSDFSDAWDFDNDTVQEDTTLYANWIAIKIIIIFVDVDLSKQEVSFDSKIAYVIPEKAEFLFLGWFKDEGLTERWNENEIVKSTKKEMKLYPSWRHLDEYHEFTKKTTDYLASEATCTEAAKYYYVCEDCGAKGTETYEVGEALGHSYHSEVVAPTEEAEGYTLHTCETCGDSYQDTFVERIIPLDKRPSVLSGCVSMTAGDITVVALIMASVAVFVVRKRKQD